MSYFSTDVESDGGFVSVNSMVCFGIVLIDPERKLNETFYGLTSPISDVYNEDALKISGFSREEHLKFPKPEETMKNCLDWLYDVNDGKRMIFLSDNNGYDFGFMNFYFLKYCGVNPFGHSSINLKNLYQGAVHDIYDSRGFKQLRKTNHNHQPVFDAIGNAEAFLSMIDKGLIKVKL